MFRMKPMIIVFFLFFGIVITNAQNRNYESLTISRDSLKKDNRLYVGLVHQHQNFFNKAFSFQGLETGVIINHTILIGAFGAMFITNLDAKVSDNPHYYINIKEAGLLIGTLINEKRDIHAGWQLNAGYFSLTGDETDYGIFKVENPSTRIGGLVFSPQFFIELKISDWMKLRTGLCYNIYNFTNQSVIKNQYLNNVSLSFGFIFGEFK